MDDPISIRLNKENEKIEKQYIYFSIQLDMLFPVMFNSFDPLLKMITAQLHIFIVF